MCKYITDIMIKQIKIGQQIKLPVYGKLVVNHEHKIYETEPTIDRCI